MSNNISSENRATIGLTREQIQEIGMGSLKEHSMKDIISEAFFNFFRRSGFRCMEIKVDLELNRKIRYI